MKKFAFGVLAVCMVVLLVISLNGGFDDVENKDIKFNEAAFSMPIFASGSEDITSFLVGEFAGEDGSHLSFDGTGSVRRIASDGMVASGSCSLVQQGDGSVMIRFIFAEGEELYAFSLTSENGDFLLKDADDGVINYSPIIF